MGVKELTINMGTMLSEQKKQGEDIEKLKAEPAERWSSMKKTVFNTIVGLWPGRLPPALFISWLSIQNKKEVNMDFGIASVAGITALVLSGRYGG